MSFASLNAVNAAKGMQGTSPTGSAQFNGPPLPAAPAGMNAQGGVASFGRAPVTPNLPTGSSYTKGAGMFMTGSSAQNQNSQAAASGQGVAPGVQIGSAVGPEQAVQFDPQDPNNAALAGYMADYKPGAPPAGPQPYSPPPIGAGAPGAGPAMANNTMGAGQGPKPVHAGPGMAQQATGPQLQAPNRNLQRVM